MQQISRVLAAVDFSKPARGAFEYALALSSHHSAELVVVHAVPRHQPFSRHAHARIALMERLRQQAAQVEVGFEERVQSGDPAEIILLHAGALRPDVIVVGSHQRTGIDRLRVRSVGGRVAARAMVPVLLVPRRRTAAVGPFRHVAVAVDFSAGSHRAVEEALTMVSGPGDRITLVHVVPGSSGGLPPHFYRYGLAAHQLERVRDARRRLQLAVPVERQTPATIQAHVLVGDTTAEISRVIDSIGADLLVVGVPKRGVVGRALFGTTAARLLRAISVPMLAVPDVGRQSARAEGSTLPLAA